MKRLINLILIGLIPMFVCTQSLDQLDYISSFNEGLAAIQKGEEWAFIDEQGNIVINYRNDLVTTNFTDDNYPVFKNGKCIIVQEKNGISYFGYINKTGKTVIEPQFLNATNFDNNIAIVLKVIKKDIGENKVLGKNVISYRYHEVTIDEEGRTIDYLNPEGISVVLDKKFLKKTPKVTSYFISNNLVATINSNNKWSIKKLKK